MADDNGVVAAQIATGGGGLIGAYGAITSGKKARRRRKRQARELLRAARARADVEVRARHRAIGDQTAAIGASGAGAGSASAFMAIVETVAQSAMEEEMILKNAAVEAKELRKIGKEEERAGFINAGSTLLTTATQAFMMGV